MGANLKLSIFSPERRLVENLDVEEVTLPGSEGEIQILTGHAPILGMLQTGAFNYRGSDQSLVFGVISSGFFEVKGDEVQVIAETLELKNEIDVDRAQKAQRLAQDTLKAADLDPYQFKKYQLKLHRSLIRQQIATQE